MTRRLLTFGALIAVVATACSVRELPEVDFGEGRRFIPSVADALDDVGLGSAVALSEDGTAYVSYLAFPGTLQPGEIAAVRPIGTPFLPAVALTGISPDGIFSRGAVQQTDPEFEPVGVEPPFRPAKVEGLALTAENANGTDVAIGPDGTIHVVWAGAEGIYHASTAPGGSSTVDLAYDYGFTISIAGPLGRPSVALDASGAPWVAFGVNGTSAVDIMVARPGADGWESQVVATAERCNGCPPPLPTGIATAGETPVVVFADPAGSVRSVRLSGEEWLESSVDTVAAAGLSVASDGGTAYASYYTADGGVALASFSGSSWTVTDVAEVAFPQTLIGLAAPTTGVAAADGQVAVTWEDAKGVHLATGDGTTFAAQETPGTAGGTRPSIAAGVDGTVVLAWVDPVRTNLMVGILGEPDGLVVANPSPVPTVSLAPVAPEGCGDEKVIDLEIVALGIQFDKNCLVAPAGRPFEIAFDHQDVGQLHNVTTLEEAGAAEAIVREDPFIGPGSATYAIPELPEGDYYFQCDVHLEMNGTLAVVKGAK
ncbi:MAG: hypothetical protein WD096_03975 [Actinomycetota bacterium]